MRIKNPALQIPGGYRFWEPSTKWQTRPFMSLDAITNNLIAHRKSRPDLIQKNGWSLDPKVVRAEVEAFNVKLCVDNGWTDYVMADPEGESPPARSFLPARNLPFSQKVRNVAGGNEILVEWINDGEPTVDKELAEKRGGVCVKCPLNGRGGWERYFTVPVSNAIRKQLERKRNMKLETSHDAELETCLACSCPLPLKLWLPIQNITSKISAEQRDHLHADCWIRSESK